MVLAMKGLSNFCVAYQIACTELSVLIEISLIMGGERY